MPHDTITGTIQLDKLVFFCTSTIDRSFFEAIQNDASLFCAANIGFNNTTLSRTTDPSNRYRYSYAVNYAGKTLGQIDFAPYVLHFQQERIKFTVANTVFYNGMHIYLEPALNDLALHIENYTKIDIAADSYTFNFEQALRRNLRNKENRVNLLHKIICNRKEIVEHITYFHQGSLDNPFWVRSISVKSKKKHKEYFVYNKLVEINHKSGKEYIIDYHKRRNPKLKHIYRAEIRLDYDAIKYVEKKRGNLQISDLFRSDFLWNVFEYEVNTIISIRDSDLQEVALYPNPNKTVRGEVDNHLPSQRAVSTASRGDNGIQQQVAIPPETELTACQCSQNPETENIPEKDPDSVPLPKKKKKRISSTKRRILRNSRLRIEKEIERIEKEIEHHQKHGTSKMFGSGKLNMEKLLSNSI